jgi:outer membrane lipoprotein-sorting protein
MKGWLFTLPLLLLLGSSLWAAEPLRQEDPILAQLQSRAAVVETLASDFIQEKHLAVFREVLISKGRFLYGRPDRLRWELTEPVRSGFVLQGEKGRRWHQHTGRSEPFTLSREPVMKLVAEQLLAWAVADFDRLRKQYQISVIGRAPVALRLEPLAGAEEFLDHLQVVFAADGSHVQSVEVHERGGDFTRIRFINSLVNGPLPADAF